MMQHRDPAEFVELSAHGQLKTEKLHEGLYLYEPKSTAHFTYPLSRVYDLPVVHEVSYPLLSAPLSLVKWGSLEHRPGRQCSSVSVSSR